MNDALIPNLPDETTAILKALDEIKAGVENRRITKLGIIAINDSGTLMGSSVLLYPQSLNPLEILGMGHAFEVAMATAVYLPVNAPQVINPAELN